MLHDKSSQERDNLPCYLRVSVCPHPAPTISESYVLNIFPLKLNATLTYDKAVTEWWFDLIGYGNWVVSQQILKKLCCVPGIQVETMGMEI